MNQKMDTEEVAKLKILKRQKLEKTKLRMPYQGQHPGQPSSSSVKKRQQNKRAEMKKGRKNQAKQKNEELSSKRRVSKPLLDTLWAKFKLRRSPTLQDCYSLAFQFNVTDKQVSQWFYEKRKKYKDEMSKLKRN